MSIDSKRQSTWDYESYAAIPNDGKRHEVISGARFVNPAPNVNHQQISRRIQFWVVFSDEKQVLQLYLIDDAYTEHIESRLITTAMEPNTTVDLLQVW